MAEDSEMQQHGWTIVLQVVFLKSSTGLLVVILYYVPEVDATVYY